jgi:hypothetical protein
VEETSEQNDPIQLPPGWGPIVFLAVVILLSNAGLGLWVSSMVATTPPRSAIASHGTGPQPGAEAGPRGSSAGGQEGPAAWGATEPQARADGSRWQVDEGEFTEELEATLRALARDQGLPPDTLPDARQLFEQMQRSNLLPHNQDLDLETVLSGHILELARDARGGSAQQPKPDDQPPGVVAPPEGASGGPSPQGLR